jgi:hypothetical protein
MSSPSYWGAFVSCWSDPVKCISGTLDGITNSSFIEAGVSIDGAKAPLADAAKQALGFNPDGVTFSAPQYAQTFQLTTGIDPANTAAVKAYSDQIGADANNFYDNQFQKNLASNPLFPSFSDLVNGAAGGGNGSVTTWIILAVVLLIILFVILKAV